MALSSAAKAQARRQAERDSIFNSIPDSEEWTREKASGSVFTTIPKPMPYIIAVLNGLSGSIPVGAVYLDLWCCGWDSPYLTIDSERERAFCAGHGGERAVETWSARMRKLHELKFIAVQEGAKGNFQHVLILNPYRAIARHQHAKNPLLDQRALSALVTRCGEVGSSEYTKALAAIANPGPAKKPAAAPKGVDADAKPAGGAAKATPAKPASFKRVVTVATAAAPAKAKPASTAKVRR